MQPSILMAIMLGKKYRPFLPHIVMGSANITNNMYKLFKCEQKPLFFSPQVDLI